MIRTYLRERKFDTPWLFAGERGDQLSRHAVQYICGRPRPAPSFSPSSHAASFLRLLPRRTRHGVSHDAGLHGPQDPRHTAHYTRISGRKSWGSSNDPSHPHRSHPQHGPLHTMALQPTLFGEWALLRESGRIGSAGRSCQAGSPPSRRPLWPWPNMSKPSSGKAMRPFEFCVLGLSELACVWRTNLASFGRR